jgi:6-phosphofructokinase 1
LIPEIPYDPEIVWRRVTGRFRRHKHFSLVVISEGARTLKGDYAVAEVRDHPDGLPILGGAGQRLRYQLEEISRREAAAIRKSGGNPPESPEIRTVVLGHIQRGGTPLGDDRIIATSCGSYAIDMVARGEIGYMSAWSFSGPKSVPLDEALAEHFVDSENDPLVKTARDIGVSFGI